MRLIVISGLSGAGKSIALHALEDLGYYAVDNLPITLLSSLVDELNPIGGPVRDRVAVVVDARNPGYAIDSSAHVIRSIRSRGVAAEVVYLEADEGVLMKRFSETRRRHPLTSDDVSLSEAVSAEREIMQAVRQQADICIDTSRTHLHELRDIVRSRIDRRPTKNLSLMFESFGFKHGPPLDADMVFDVRCLPNPYWEPALRPLTGRDEPVQSFLDGQSNVSEMFASLLSFLERWVPAFEADNRAYLTIAIGCTGGRHRSVYMAEKLAQYFQTQRSGVIIRHREL